jgi:RimJ/RimL family protein N-acetyltransferase
MHLVSPPRTIFGSRNGLAIAELLDGEQAAVDAQCDRTFELDPDERPVPFQVTRFRAALLDVDTGELLGTMSWRPVPHGPTLSGTAWNMGIKLVPAVRRRGLSAAAGLLLARHLFDTTGVDRVQAITDVANVPGWRGLEKAGFHREGIVRGGTLRGGQRRDMFSYSLLRSDLAAGERRTVLISRAGVVLAATAPTDRAELEALLDKAFVLDIDRAQPPAVHRATVLDERGGRPLGMVSWHAVGYVGAAAWNIGIALIPDARGRGVGTTAQRLLAEHLFATTELGRVQAATDVDDVAERRALEKAGFQLDGTIRGAQQRDLALYGMLRADLG